MRERRLTFLQGGPKATTTDWKEEWMAQHGRESVPKELASTQESASFGHLKQLWNDTRRYHIRADGIPEAAGSFPLAVGAGIGKIGNAVVGDISNALGAKTRPVALGEGNLKYMRRDVASIADNAIDFGKNVITLHPIRAIGNAVKGGFDAVDLTFIDPILDGGTAVFGHAYERRSGSVFSQNMTTRKQIAQLQKKAPAQAESANYQLAP